MLYPHGHCRSWLDFFVRFHPRPAQTYWAALQRGDSQTAWDVYTRYEEPLRRFGQRCRYGMDGFIKHALLEAAGVAPRWRRSPAPNPTDEEIEQVRDQLRTMGML